MQTLLLIIRLFAISQLLLLMVLLWRSTISRRVVWITCSFCVGLAGYLIISSGIPKEHTLFYPLLLITSTFPWSFWMLSQLLFDDDFEVKPWMLWLLLGVLGYNSILYFSALNSWVEKDSEVGLLLQLVMFCLSLGFILMSLVQALKNSTADLVQDRITFRSWFVGSTATLMMLTVLTEIAFMSNEPPLWLELVQKTIILGLLMYFITRLFDMKANVLLLPRPDSSKTRTTAPAVDEVLLEKLLLAMEEQEKYKTEGLSIGQLADDLAVKEYILRKTINQHLGYRNFNAFLNHYRIKEACKVLTNPIHKQLTVLEIAYSLGYQSLAPFNKAFKQQTGTTPTQWRKQHLKEEKG